MKIKYANDGCYLIANVKCGFGEHIQHDMLEQFTQKSLPFFLKAIDIKKRKVCYRGIQSISLKDYLKNPVSKFDFLFILAQFVRLIKGAEDNNLPLSYISYDLSNCFLTENTKELQLIFLPIKTRSTRSLPNDFIETFVYSSKPIDGENYISTFAYFFRKQTGFNAKSIEKFIEKEDGRVYQLLDGKKSDIVICDGLESKNRSESKIRKRELGMVDGDATFLGDELTTDNDTLLRDDTILGEEETLLGESEDDTLLGDGSTDDDETAYLVPKDDHVSPSLKRVLTNESIRITKSCFRIGSKESEVDYVVRNNNTISRSHADFIIECGKYFVYDLSSKNKTYVNDRVIPVQTRVQIYHNDIIRLSDEDFVFCVE